MSIVEAVVSSLRRLKACLNGSRHRGEHPAPPVTPAQLAADAAAAVAAGAEAVHLHPRDAHGSESLDASDIGAAVAAVRATNPGTPIGVSTGLWITGSDVALREAAVSAWSALPAVNRPDFASVNVSEHGFADLTVALLAAGIAVEAGVWSAADADALAASGVAPRCLRILVEIIGALEADAEPAALAILDRLDAHGLAAPRLLHGENATAWPLVALAGRLGLPTRIGLEDALVGADGRPARDNADLVRQALTVHLGVRGADIKSAGATAPLPDGRTP
jgi:uncharacterized protein (DUF849 family)